MLADLVDSIAQALEKLVDATGAPGIAVVAFFENMFPPTPSEFLYPLAGKYAADGDLSLVTIVVAGVIGSLIGSLIYYAIGYYLGPERTRDFVARYGTIRLFGLHFAMVTVEDYDRALGWFEKRGSLVIFIARIMPVVHSVVSIPAGVTRMNLPWFITVTTLGVIAWVAPLAIFGYWLGNNWEKVLEVLDIYQTIWYLLIAALLVWFVFRRVRSARTTDTITEN